jgi:hypothetical protein
MEYDIKRLKEKEDNIDRVVKRYMRMRLKSNLKRVLGLKLINRYR